jgi:Hydrazine synthase alpha subunit middle domain
MKYSWLFALLFLVACVRESSATLESQALPYPIVFVTQVPHPADFTTILSTFGNQRSDIQSAPRGGDLWIRYPDGTLKNLTKAAGYGVDGFQSAKAIAVRDPVVHWNGTKILFSMVVGAPKQYEVTPYYWQLYEITGLGKTDTPVITKIAGQPATYNNVAPIYSSTDSIIFTSDRPRDGQVHLYPQLDEYEGAPTVSGLYLLSGNTLSLLDHAPSGDFSPMLDSFGRVLFTRWDHLQRDQLFDSDILNGGTCTYCATTFASEAKTAVKVANSEVFPEPRPDRKDLLAGTPYTGHLFNHFFPWMMNQDGTQLETLNHLGRHELQSYIEGSRNDDPNVVEYYGQYPRTNPNPTSNMFQLSEDPRVPGRYLGIDAPEFGSHGAGQVIALRAAPGKNPDTVVVEYLTHRDTATVLQDGATASPNHSGVYRNPLVLSQGTFIAAHSSTTLYEENIGTSTQPKSRYAFRLKTLVKSGSYYLPSATLTRGINETISYYDPDVLVSYSGPLWELSPVEVRPRTRPPVTGTPALASPEAAMFTQAGVSLSELQTYLRQNNLALVVSRNVTLRDDADKQQPFNLRVPGGVSSQGAAGKSYDVSYLQFFQANQVRGYQADPGRRVLAQVMRNRFNSVSAGATGSVVLGKDGSMAAFVPARRALTWQLTDSRNKGVVLERNWLTFQPGEVRVCASCHGVNQKSQTGTPDATNSPQALGSLLEYWKTNLR